jgi:hypothetical protein
MQDVNDDSPDAIIRQARVALGSRLREIRESRGMPRQPWGQACRAEPGLGRSF